MVPQPPPGPPDSLFHYLFDAEESKAEDFNLPGPGHPPVGSQSRIN